MPFGRIQYSMHLATHTRTHTHTHSWYIELEGGGRVGAREGTREGGSKVRVGWSKGTLGGREGAMM